MKQKLEKALELIKETLREMEEKNNIDDEIFSRLEKAEITIETVLVELD